MLAGTVNHGRVDVERLLHFTIKAHDVLRLTRGDELCIFSPPSLGMILVTFSSSPLGDQQRTFEAQHPTCRGMVRSASSGLPA